ncbi:MAG: LON peptidase substrate-binding domain-containing protein [Calditrichia bacterium]
MYAEDIIPLFPLGLVLLPEVPLPLHIFEERYKIMVQECLETDQPFGIVYYDGSQMKNAGCTARIVEVLKRYASGRMDILVQGERRFEGVEVFHDKVYLQAKVEYFDDEAEDYAPEMEEISEKAYHLLKELVKLSRRQELPLPETVLEPKILSFLIAGSYGFSSPEKQEFLEMKSTTARLEREVKSLEKIIERIKLSQEIEKIVKGNGHLPQLMK